MLAHRLQLLSQGRPSRQSQVAARPLRVRTRPCPVQQRGRAVLARVSTVKRPESFAPDSISWDEDVAGYNFLSKEEEYVNSVDEEDGNCPVYIDREGNIINVMCCDYGFRSNSGRLYQEGYGKIPHSMWHLAWANFAQEWTQLRRSFRYDEYGKIAAVNPPQGPLGKASYAAGSAVVRLFSRLDRWLEERRLFSALLPEALPKEVFDTKTGSMTESCKQIRSKLAQLKLSNKAVWDREHAREAAGGGVDTPWFVKGIYLSLCVFLDVAYDNRPLQRFWFLETVARMPYFSYITMLHLYESFGWWRAGAELRKVHFAEEWNEMHHLQIMESLGGDQLWVDRFMAQHAAIVYYIILVGLFTLSPQLAYNFSELIEAHAVDTYGEFADANKELLQTLPPPLVAAQYYLSGDYYLFDEFQTSLSGGSLRTPKCDTLYDVFINIRDDEGEHVKTMAACQDFSIMDDLEVRRETERRI
uniref:Ubiquinol oxidase n=1 Tax=Tetradesmus obliquus TaxID=3088 RepID=A0A383VUK8_TETOB|eukprot:jgi/Sobl393_1/9986/SZX68454.1